MTTPPPIDRSFTRDTGVELLSSKFTSDGRPLHAHSDGAQLPFREDFRCTASRRDGSGQCKQPAIVGGSVCRFHGGNAPQVRAAGRRRIEANRLANDAAKLLTELENDFADQAPVDALHESVGRISAMVEVLAALAMEATPTGGDRAVVARNELGKWIELQLRAAKIASDAGVDDKYKELTEIRERARREAEAHATDLLYERLTSSAYASAVRRSLAEVATQIFQSLGRSDTAELVHGALAHLEAVFARVFDDEMQRIGSSPRDPSRCEYQPCETFKFWWCTCGECVEHRRDCGCQTCTAWLTAHGDEHVAECPCPACNLRREHDRMSSRPRSRIETQPIKEEVRGA